MDSPLSVSLVLAPSLFSFTRFVLTSLHQLHISPPSTQCDAEMHYEPLLHSPSSTATQASQCTLPQSNADTAPPSPAALPAQCTFPQSNTAVIISSDESSSSNFLTAASNIPGKCALLRIVEYTSSYICSASLCESAREHCAQTDPNCCSE